MFTWVVGFLAGMVLLGAGPPAVPQETPAWKYVVPPDGDPFAHPPLRALVLTGE